MCVYRNIIHIHIILRTAGFQGRLLSGINSKVELWRLVDAETGGKELVRTFDHSFTTVDH